MSSSVVGIGFCIFARYSSSETIVPFLLVKYLSLSENPFLRAWDLILRLNSFEPVVNNIAKQLASRFNR